MISTALFGPPFHLGTSTDKLQLLASKVCQPHGHTFLVYHFDRNRCAVIRGIMDVANRRDVSNAWLPAYAFRPCEFAGAPDDLSDSDHVILAKRFHFRSAERFS